MAPEHGDITRILIRASEGDGSAIDQLMPLVYNELRELAEHHLKQERPGHTLQATALVHEAYLRLVKQDAVQWRSRAHFFAIASQAIRRILVDHARARRRAKRGGDRRVDLDVAIVPAGEDCPDLLALDEALTELAGLHERQARIVELHFFGGFTIDDVARYLGVSERTVYGDWSMARAWLHRQLKSA
jgi:RNA polymerase sigma factor (TIGR02999 family)